MKASEVRNISQAIGLISRDKVPFKLSYRLSKLITAFDGETKLINEALVAKIQEFGGVEGVQGSFEIKSPGAKASKKEKEEYEENVKKFNEESQKILDEDLEVQFVKIPKSAFPDDLAIEPGILLVLEKLIDDET